MSNYDVPGDKELALEEHLTEIRKRLIVVLVALGFLTFLTFPFTDSIISLLRQEFIPEGTKIIVLSPMEFILMRLQLSIVFALLLSIPLIIYEAFAFMEPGLFPNERKVFTRFIPASLLLFIIGASISYLFMIFFSINLLIGYVGDIATPMLVLKRFISFVSFMLLSFGLISQIPLIIYLGIKSELISSKDLKDKRKYAYALLLILALTLAPDPTPVTPLVIMAFLILVYEISVFFADNWSKRG